MTGILTESRTRTAGAVMAGLTRWIGIASVILSALIFVAELDESFALPDCDSTRASQALRELARASHIEAASVVEPQTLTSAADEVSCKAALAFDEGGSIGVRYRFFWEGWTVKIEITESDE